MKNNNIELLAKETLPGSGPNITTEVRPLTAHPPQSEPWSAAPLRMEQQLQHCDSVLSIPSTGRFLYLCTLFVQYTSTRQITQFTIVCLKATHGRQPCGVSKQGWLQRTRAAFHSACGPTDIHSPTTSNTFTALYTHYSVALCTYGTVVTHMQFVVAAYLPR